MRIARNIRLIGFTIIELLIVITVMGLLTSIGVLSYKSIQINTRDTERSSKMNILSTALEKYYEKNGEYPSCHTMSQSPEIISSNVLIGINPETFSSPNAKNNENSLLPNCTDITIDSDNFAYIGDSNSTCTVDVSETGHCDQYTLKYIEELSGTVIAMPGRN